MNRLFLLTGALIMGVALAGTVVQADEKDSKFDIGEFMKKSHGKAGLRQKITTAVLKEKDFDSAKEVAKEWLTEAQKLSKATPPKGEKAAWERTATAYCKQVKALSDACTAKDGDKAKAALDAIGKSCGGCHKAHKGK